MSAPPESRGVPPVPAATGTAPAASAGPAASTGQTAAASAPQGEVAAGTGSLQVRADAPAAPATRPGFRTRTRNGETVWCHKETPTGSRMSVETCYTAAQLAQMDAAAESVKDTFDKVRTPCTGRNCVN
jgi:hypothetical protein